MKAILIAALLLVPVPLLASSIPVEVLSSQSQVHGVSSVGMFSVAAQAANISDAYDHVSAFAVATWTFRPTEEFTQLAIREQHSVWATLNGSLRDLTGGFMIWTLETAMPSCFYCHYGTEVQFDFRTDHIYELHFGSAVDSAGDIGWASLSTPDLVAAVPEPTSLLLLLLGLTALPIMAKYIERYNS